MKTTNLRTIGRLASTALFTSYLLMVNPSAYGMTSSSLVKIPKAITSIVLKPIQTNVSKVTSKAIRMSRLRKISRVYAHVPMTPDHVLVVVDLCYQYGIDPDLVLAIIEVESHYKPYAKNKTSSARGYSQMIASTANSLSKRLGYRHYNHSVDAYDPNINLNLMVYYVHYLLTTSSSTESALIKYRGCNDRPYIKKILNRRAYIKSHKRRS